MVVVTPQGMSVTTDTSEENLAGMVEQPAKVMRIGSMIKQLLEEVRSAPLDEAGRARLADVHSRSIAELETGLSDDLTEELRRLALPFEPDATPSDAELRIAQAQLVGWLEGLFHGIQTTLFAQQMAARAQLEQMRRQALPGGPVVAPGTPPDSRPRRVSTSDTGQAPGGAVGLRDRVAARLRPRHPLGEGLWRGDFDRVDRASQRVLQVLGHQGAEAPQLVADLTACRELCGAAAPRPWPATRTPTATCPATTGWPPRTTRCRGRRRRWRRPRRRSSSPRATRPPRRGRSPRPRASAEAAAAALGLPA